MCPRTLDPVTDPKVPSKRPKVPKAVSLTLKTAGAWELIEAKKDGTGAFKLEFTGNAKGQVRIVLDPDPGTVPPLPKPRWTIEGDGEWVISGDPHSGQVQHWIGSAIMRVDPIHDVMVFVV
jgi:hypothetical protein